MTGKRLFQTRSGVEAFGTLYRTQVPNLDRASILRLGLAADYWDLPLAKGGGIDLLLFLYSHSQQA